MSEDLDRFGQANFADGSTGGDAGAERLRQRLAQEKGPTTASSTSKWRTGGNVGMLGHRTPDASKVSLTDCHQMRRDPMIAFGLSFIKAYLARADWYIKSSDPRRAAFIDGALRRIYGRFVLQWGGCLDYGYQALVKNFERGQVDWTYIDDTGAELKVWPSSAPPLLWKPFTALNPKWAQPVFNLDGEFDGINYNVAASGSRFPFEPGGSEDPAVPLEWALWATNEKDSVFGSLYGYPRTGYAYRYWWAYWYRFGLADRAFEKWADPPVIAYHPVELATGDDGNARNFTAEALALAEKIRSGANVSLPSTPVESMQDGRATNLRAWELTQMKVETNFDALNDAFEYLDVSKLRALMVPEQAFLEGKGGTSSRNVASTLGDTFEESQAVIKAEIDDHINRYMIPQLLEANFGPGGATCEIVTTGFDAQDVETGRAIVQAFAQNAPAELAGIDIRKLLTRLGIPMLNPTQAKKAQEELLANLQKMKPAPVQPKDGSSGVNDKGQYVSPTQLEDATQQVRIELSQEFKEQNEVNLKRFARVAGRVIRREIDLAEAPAPVEEDDDPTLALEQAETKAEERALGMMEKFFDLFRSEKKAQELVIRVADEEPAPDGGPDNS
jgi:hypothetical protein